MERLGGKRRVHNGYRRQSEFCVCGYKVVPTGDWWDIKKSLFGVFTAIILPYQTPGTSQPQNVLIFCAYRTHLCTASMTYLTRGQQLILPLIVGLFRLFMDFWVNLILFIQTQFYKQLFWPGLCVVFRLVASNSGRPRALRFHIFSTFKWFDLYSNSSCSTQLLPSNLLTFTALQFKCCYH